MSDKLKTPEQKAKYQYLFERKAKYQYLFERKSNDCVDRYWLVSEKETENEVIRTEYHERTFESTGETFCGTSRSKQQKFICVNGPNAGQKLTLTQAWPLGYMEFNCGQNAHRTKTWPRCVLVNSIFLTPTGMVKMA